MKLSLDIREDSDMFIGEVLTLRFVSIQSFHTFNLLFVSSAHPAQ